MFLAAALLLVASVAGKLIGIHIAGRILKWQPGEASIIGWMLQTKALIMIIFVNVLLDKKIISSEAFTGCLVVEAVTRVHALDCARHRIEREEWALSHQEA